MPKNKCLFCKKKTEKFVCDSCREFLEYKYKKEYKNHIEKIKNYFSKIKFRRTR